MTIVSRRTMLTLPVLACRPFSELALRAAAGESRPNILFIMTDDHASQAIGCYGSQVNQTPNLDRLAREGMRIDRVFATNSICTPSRATILTGKYSHVNGVPVFNRFDGSQPTVPKMLQQAGLLHGDDRQVAPGQRPDRFRLLEHPARPGRLQRPDLLRPGRVARSYKGYATDIIDRHHHRLPEEPAEGQAVLPHVAPQGAAPGVDPRREAPEACSRTSQIPEPPTLRDDYAGRTDAHPRAAAVRLPGPDPPRPQARAAGGADRRRAAEVDGGQAHRGRDRGGRRQEDADRRGA